jgi:aminopeptidase N
VADFYEKNPEYRIVHDSLTDMEKVVSSQTYQKGSWTLHMLRGVMGTDNFWKGIRAYYAKYQNMNASTADFRIEMEEASGLDLRQFFEQWLYKSGTLVYEGNWKYNAQNQEVKITLNQVQQDGSLFKMPLEVALHFKDGKTQIKLLTVNERNNEFTLKVDSEPEDIILDPTNWVLMEASFKRIK